MKHKKIIYSLILLGLSCSSGLVNSTVTAENINLKFTANKKVLHFDIRGAHPLLMQELKNKTAAIVNIWLKSKKPLHLLGHKHQIQINETQFVLLTDINFPNPKKAHRKVLRLKWKVLSTNEINPPDYNGHVIMGNKKDKNKLKKKGILFDVAETSYYFK